MMLRHFFHAATASLFIAACSGPPPHPDTFTRTGEMIALSGGGRGAAGSCMTCHGLNGEGDGHLVPRLAGLDRGYLERQLNFFAYGQRAHPQMAAIAKALSRPERGSVAAYYESLGENSATIECGAATLATARLYQFGDARRGIASCASCHGANGRGVGLGNPPLAGQPSAYLAAQLDRWRSGRRYGDPLGTMTRISQRLKPDEVRALAVYAATLSDGLSRSESLGACPPARRADPRNGVSVLPRRVAERAR